MFVYGTHNDTQTVSVYDYDAGCSVYMFNNGDDDNSDEKYKHIHIR